MGNKPRSQYLTKLKEKFPNFMERIDILTPQERYVLLERLEGKTLAAIAPLTPRLEKTGGGFGYSRERIHQYERRACRRLLNHWNRR